MGLEITVNSLEDMCNLMCNNQLPKKKKKRYRLYVTRVDHFGGTWEEVEATSSDYYKLSEKAKEIAQSRKVVNYQIVEID